MMLEWLAEKHALPEAARAGALVRAAIDTALAAGARPMETGGTLGTLALTEAVLAAMENLPA